MRPFSYVQVDTPRAAMREFVATRETPSVSGRPSAEYFAGGTTLLDLMKLDVMRPTKLIDINGLSKDFKEIKLSPEGLHLGAFAHMADVADHPKVKETYPVVAQSLQLAASAQIRNMATLGGNVLQRTRCPYFRDLGWTNCNKRKPGSGCTAIESLNRGHAVLGTSEVCIATYPGDFAQALIALDASVEVVSAGGTRIIPFSALHRPPDATPHIENNLAPGELIVRFHIPGGPWTRRSLYLKIRDRQSYEFALASAAVALASDGGAVRQVRIGLGGVATTPWRAKEAEAFLTGHALSEDRAWQAARIAFAGAVTHADNGFKVTLGQATLVRALLQVSRLEV